MAMSHAARQAWRPPREHAILFGPTQSLVPCLHSPLRSDHFQTPSSPRPIPQTHSALSRLPAMMPPPLLCSITAYTSAAPPTLAGCHIGV